MKTTKQPGAFGGRLVGVSALLNNRDVPKRDRLFALSLLRVGAGNGEGDTVSNCPWCGSRIVFGGPRCCDRGASKRNREAEIQVVLEVRRATMERRIAALEQRLTTLLEVTP